MKKKQVPGYHATALPKNIHQPQAHKGSVEAEPHRPSEEMNFEETGSEEVAIQPAVKPYVKKTVQEPVIPEDLAKLGVANTKVPTEAGLSRSVALPLPEKDIPRAMKQPLFQSFRWLGTLSYYILEQSRHHITSKRDNVIRFIRKILWRELGRLPKN